MSEIAQFETECAAAGVTPSDACRAGGIAPSTFFRWRSGSVSPTLRKLEAARAGLRRLIDSGHGVSSSCDDEVVAPGTDRGAEKSLAVFSTGDAA